jgi:hypothetical protein
MHSDAVVVTYCTVASVISWITRIANIDKVYAESCEAVCLHQRRAYQQSEDRC